MSWKTQKPEPGVSENLAEEFVDLGTEQLIALSDLSIKLDFEVKIHEHKNFKQFVTEWRLLSSESSAASIKQAEHQNFYIVTAGLSDRLQELSKKNESILNDSIATNLNSLTFAGNPVKVVLQKPDFVDLDVSDSSSSNNQVDDSDEKGSDGSESDEEFFTPKSSLSMRPPPHQTTEKSSPPPKTTEDTEKKKLKQENELLQRELQKLKEAQQNERNRLETMLITLKLDLMTLMNEIRSSGVGFVLDRLQGRVSFIP